MFGIGLTELVALLLAGLLYLGAKVLPEAGKSFGEADLDEGDDARARQVPESAKPRPPDDSQAVS